MAVMSSTSGASPSRRAPCAARRRSGAARRRRRARAAERGRLLHQRMRTDDESGATDRRAAPRRRGAPSRVPSRDEHRRDVERLEQAPHRPRMLLGEQLRRGHDRRLEAVLHREQRANSATIVLPLPTSPCSSRCIRRSLHMSAKISRSTRVCAPVSVNGSASRSRVVSWRLFSKRMPRRASRASALARCWSSCTNSSSSNASRARPSIASPSDEGRCTMRSASRMPAPPRRAARPAADTR